MLRWISRGRVIRRTLSAQFGSQTLHVTPHASLRYWKPGIDHADPELMHFIDQHVKPGDVVWDIGASVGVFSFAAAWRAGTGGQVLALEPDTWIHSLLQKSIELQCTGRAPIQSLCYAAGSKCKVDTFNITRLSRSTGHLATLSALQSRVLTGGVELSIQVPVVTLDSLLEKHAAPTVVKIDVEGAEALVLQGASRLLSEVRPLLYCEAKLANQMEVTNLLHQAGYCLFALDNARRQTPLRAAARNTLALPEESLADMQRKIAL